MKTPPIVSAEEWRAAREQLLVKEKELARARDQLAAERRRMPWLVVDKEYWFEGPAGRVSLAGLFEGRRQPIVYSAFYGPEVTTYAEGGSYPERACVGCSFLADQVADPGHLHARNTTLAFASRAPRPRSGPEAAPRVESHPLVHDHRRLRQGLRRRRVARHQRLHPPGRPGLPDLLHQQSRRRRWAAPGTTSASPLSAARRRGRTRRRATRKHRRTSGGTTTTCTTRPSDRPGAWRGRRTHCRCGLAG